MNSMPSRRGYPEEMQHALAQAESSGAGVQAFPPTVPGQVFFHFDIRRSLQMHKGLAIGILLFFVLGAAAYVAKTWNNFQAESIVYVQPASPKVIDQGQPARWPNDANTYESYIQQQVHVATRPDVLLAAVKKIPGWQSPGESDQSAVGHLSRKVTVDRVGSTYQISIQAKAKRADLSAQMANAVAASFIDSATRELRAGDSQRLEILREERDRVMKELAQDRAEQEDLNKKLGIAAVSGAIPDPFDEQISAIRAELLKARTANDDAASRLMAETRGPASQTALDAQAEEIAASDAGLVSMKTALNKRRSEIITQMANLTPNHPTYKQDSEELLQINASLEKMGKEVHTKAAARISQRLKADLDRTASMEARLNGQLSQMIATAGTATPRLQRFNDLTSDIQRLQQRFTVVDEQFRNLTMENSAPGSVYMSQAATAPLNADRSLVMRNAFVLLIMGIVLSLGGALVAQNLDKRIYIATDVERVLGFPPMAQLPDLYEVGTGVSEEYMLRLAAAVEHAYQEGALKSCIFTGADPGAGVTTVVKRVTGMLEAMGRSTVAVDASGGPAPSPAAEPGRELVAQRGSRSTALLQQMSEETAGESVVITDTAPLLVSGETEYLARFVDSAIVVLESGVTTRDQLRRVADTLQRLGVRSVGFVLNRISLEMADQAFRNSIKAVERHVAAQTRNFARETVRTPSEEPGEPPFPVSSDTRDFVSGLDYFAAANQQEASLSQSQPTVRAEQGKNSAVAEELIPIQTRPVVEASAPEPVIPTDVKVTEKCTVDGQRGRTDFPGSPLPRGRKAEFGTSGKVADSMAGAVKPTPQRGDSLQPAFSSQPVPPATAPLRPEAAEPIPAPATTASPETVWGTPSNAASPSTPSWQTEMLGVVPPMEPVEATPPPQIADAQAVPAQIPFATVSPVYTSWSQAAPHTSIGRTIAERLTPAQSPQPVAVASFAPASVAPTPVDNRYEDLPYSAASRLGGLRNLLVTLGLHTIRKDGDAPSAAPLPDRPAPRPVYAEPMVPFARQTEPNPTQSVMAIPEFLPPTVAAEPAESEKEAARPAKQSRPTRWDTSDDVETLPSWRGQYRKRR